MLVLIKQFVRGSAVTVIRDTSVDLAKRIDGVKAGASQEGRTVVLGKSSLNIGHWIRDWNPQNVQLTRAAGEQGTGKSTVLLHSITHALNSGWIVLYVPKGELSYLHRLQSCNPFAVLSALPRIQGGQARISGSSRVPYRITHCPTANIGYLSMAVC